MGKLVGFDVGLAVLAAVAKVVDKHWGSTLESMHLSTTNCQLFRHMMIIYGVPLLQYQQDEHRMSQRWR